MMTSDYFETAIIDTISSYAHDKKERHLVGSKNYVAISQRLPPSNRTTEQPMEAWHFLRL